MAFFAAGRQQPPSWEQTRDKMRRLQQLAVLGASVSLIAASVGIAQAEPPPPLHGHVLVLGVEYDENDNPIGYDKCVELANGKKLKLNAHHAHAHTGAAGEALGGAGHAVVPMAPLTPLTSCDDLPLLLGPPQ